MCSFLSAPCCTVDLLYCVEDPGGLTGEVCEDFRRGLQDEGIVVKVLNGEKGPGRREVRFQQHQRPGNVVSEYENAHDTLMALVEIPCTSSPENMKRVRVDFVGVHSAAEWPFATLAWSGSTMFQRELRRYAKYRLGMIFNSHGLFYESNGARVELKPPCRSEHDIFEAMMLNYLAPYVCDSRTAVFFFHSKLASYMAGGCRPRLWW